MKKYNIVYADPAWKMRDSRNADPAFAGITYDVMSTKDICNLPVKKIADKNCVLFLWTTSPMLPDALEVMKAWGFKYKCVGFVWVKLNPKQKTPVSLMGHYTMSSTEYVLIGVKGHPKRVCKNVRQLVQEIRTGHSVKPKEVHKRIVDLYGDVPRIELFARDCVPGWECHGGDIDHKDLKEVLEGLANE